MEAVDVELILVELKVVTLGGIVHTADQTDGIHKGVAQNENNQCQSNQQDDVHVVEATLCFCLLIHV